MNAGTEVSGTKLNSRLPAQMGLNHRAHHEAHSWHMADTASNRLTFPGVVTGYTHTHTCIYIYIYFFGGGSFWIAMMRFNVNLSNT